LQVEYRDAWGEMLGEEGRGIATILEMVHHTRLDCLVGSAGLIRRCVTEAAHHAAHRDAFGVSSPSCDTSLRCCGSLSLVPSPTPVFSFLSLFSRFVQTRSVQQRCCHRLL